MGENYDFCRSSRISFNPTSHLNDVTRSWKIDLNEWINECLAKLYLAKRRLPINKGVLQTEEKWRTMM